MSWCCEKGRDGLWGPWWVRKHQLVGEWGARRRTWVTFEMVVGTEKEYICICINSTISSFMCCVLYLLLPFHSLWRTRRRSMCLQTMGTATLDGKGQDLEVFCPNHYAMWSTFKLRAPPLHLGNAFFPSLLLFMCVRACLKTCRCTWKFSLEGGGRPRNWFSRLK